MGIAFILKFISAHRLVLKYVINGIKASCHEQRQDDETLAPLIAYLEAVETVKHASDSQLVARLVKQHKLFPQHIPTWMNNSKEVLNYTMSGVG